MTDCQSSTETTIWEGLSPPYRTIVADPPWKSNNAGGAYGAMGTARVARYAIDVRPDAFYSTMTVEDICALPVPLLADRDAHLYLWTTCSDIARALAVMESWGFTYKTMLTWVKVGRWGLGAYFRTQTEHVLFGVRGSLPTSATDQLNYFEARKAGHSVKPAAFADIVERSSPGPYIELFARAPRLGWDHWGYGYEETS
jgi:N6-adenosine-specific RNA methylase IME4